MAVTTRLPFAEWVCLTLITQKVSHGWALGTMLAPDGEVGRIWTLSRPLTYRAIDGLVDKGLITRTGQAAGRGRDRVILAATPAGRRVVKRWLDAPVEHLRDVRTELLVKLYLRAIGPVSTTSSSSPCSSSCSEPTIDALDVDQRRRRPRRPVAAGERPRRAPLPRRRRCIRRTGRRRVGRRCGSVPATSSPAR